VAVIYKRGSIDRQTNTETSNQMFTDIAQLINSGNLQMQLIACSILTAILNEFSSTSSTSSVGLTWEFHHNCKAIFEQNDLKLIFTYCLQTLSELSSSPFLSSPATAGQSTQDLQVTTLLSRFLTIMEQILSWDFIPKNLPRRFMGSFGPAQAVSFKPPSSWMDIVLNKQIISMLFNIHKKVRTSEQLCTQSLQCLVQLASTNGSIFSKDELQIEYLTYFIDSLLELLSSTELLDYEALGIANIINNLVTFSPLPTLLQLRSDCLHSFWSLMARLACNFCQAAAKEDASDSDETIWLETFDKSLDAWIKFISCANELPEGAIQHFSVDILDTYLRCHLAPPQGVRGKLSADETVGMSDNEDDEDREKFSDQLFAIGSFARHIPEYSVPLLTRLLDERVHVLQSLLEAVPHTTDSQQQEQQQLALNELNEDLHWILLIITDTLTDQADGETILIPAPIMDYSISLQGGSDALTASTTMTIKELITESNDNTYQSSRHLDPIVRLMASVFRAVNTEQLAIDSGLGGCLSPQVGQSLMRLLARWAESYLAPNEGYYAQISVGLVTSFGKDSLCTQWTVMFLLEKVLLNLKVFYSEHQLLADTLSLLTALVDKQPRCDLAVRCETLWRLVADFSSNKHPLNILPPIAKRGLCQALVLAGSASFPDDRKTVYMQQVLESIQNRFLGTVQRSDLKTTYHNVEVKNDILGSFDCLCGVAEASAPNNGSTIFEFFSGKLQVFVDIMDLYHNYEEVVQVVLDTFKIVNKKLICYLSETECVSLYKATVSLIDTYSKHNIGLRNVKKDREEEQYKDLVTLMQILSSVLCKDFISFASGDDSLKCSVSAADVVVFGLSTIIPLLTTQLLMFPSLAQSYMSLVSYMSEIHPSYLCRLTDDIFNSLMSAVEFCLLNCAVDVVKYCLELLTSLTMYIQQDSALRSSDKHSVGTRFLTIFFNMLLLETFDMSLMDTFSAAFYTLICSHQDEYKKLVNDLLSQHTGSPHYDRLVNAFNQLTGFSDAFNITRSARIKFTENFTPFLTNIRGFLCIR